MPHPLSQDELIRQLDRLRTELDALVEATAGQEARLRLNLRGARDHLHRAQEIAEQLRPAPGE